MNWDSVQQVLRILLNAGGGVLVSKGYLTEDMLTTAIGGFLSVGSVVWWFFWNRKAQPTTV